MRIRTIVIAAAALAVPLSAAGLGTAAHAATKVQTVSATTMVTDRLDSGFGGNDWASDTIARTVSATLVGKDSNLDDCGSATACYTYTGMISDTGTAHAIAGQTSPGAQGAGITGNPTAKMVGHATVQFHSSSDVPSAKLVPATASGNEVSTPDWVEQLFPEGTTFGADPSLDTWTWTYTDSADCQTWVDAYNIAKADSGDITGVNQCPVVSAGHATVSEGSATVTWKATHSSEFEVTITGPGPDNGLKQKVTTDEVVYHKLWLGHTYEVEVQPLIHGQPAGKAGKITFHTVKH